MDDVRSVLSFLILVSGLVFFGVYPKQSFSIHEINTTTQTNIPHSNDSSSLTPFTLGESSSDNQATESTQQGGNVILLSQRYNEEEFSNEIVGEVENNGTEPVEFVQVTANFYDSNGGIVGTENTYTDPSDLRPGMKAPFKILLLSGSQLEDSDTYEFTIQWDNPDGSTGVNTVKGEGVGESEEDDGENDEQTD